MMRAIDGLDGVSGGRVTVIAELSVGAGRGLQFERASRRGRKRGDGGRADAPTKRAVRAPAPD